MKISGEALAVIIMCLFFAVCGMYERDKYGYGGVELPAYHWSEGRR